MRIRSIKPEFWRSQSIASLPIDDRLLFIGLWSYVDDNGVGRDSCAFIAADLFAIDLERDSRETFARVSRGLLNLSERGRIVRYAVDGQPFLEVINWSEHQRIDKPNKARYPHHSNDSAVIRESVARVSRECREDHAPGAGEQRSRGTEEQVTSMSDPDGSDATVYPADFLKFWAIYPRREKKRPALASWKRAKKRSTPAAITVGAACYRDDPNREKAFTKLPTTWLDGDCWDDDPLPERAPAMSRQGSFFQSEMARLAAKEPATVTNLHQIGAGA